MLRLPTGAGKTVVAALIIEKLLMRLDGKRILFLSHRKEIVEQTAEKIGIQVGSARVTIDQAERRADTQAPIVVASIQSLLGRLDEYDPQTFGAIIIDECHHAFAKTWLHTIGYFGKRQESLLLGLTATSKRSDGRCVSTLFQETAFEISLGELQEAGHLVPLAYFTVEASLGLNKIGFDNEGDFPASFLGRIMNTPEVIALTLRAWREQSSKLKTIAFCASVAHAEELARSFRDLGVKAACVNGKSSDRDDIIRDFRSGKLQILTNFGVLTEGFDEPSIECVLLCRPTSSPLVYTQCLGRGLRTFPGKKSCTVIDIIDRQSHGLQYNAFEAAGLKRSWKSPGKDPVREAAAISRIRVTDPLAFMKIKNALSMEETQSILMSLDPKTVLAGIDGKPLLRYTVKDKALDPGAALEEAKRLIELSGPTLRDLRLDNWELKVQFKEEDKSNLSTYLSWHIERATGWRLAISFCAHTSTHNSNIETEPSDYIYEKLEEFDQSEFDSNEFMLTRQQCESKTKPKSRHKSSQDPSLIPSKVKRGASSSSAAKQLGSTRSIQGLMLALKEELDSNSREN